MKIAFGTILCGLAATVLVAVPSPAADTPPAGTGRVLVLENERALEGDVRCEGDRYCVKRGTGELWLSGDKVLKLCSSWEEAFAFVRSQANLRDPDERLRLARWCLVYGLREQGLAEATAAVQMRPSHAPSRQLLTALQRPAAAPQQPAPAPTTVVAKAPTVLPPAIELSADALGVFATRVQPVLMNTCASCHAGGKETAFTLSRAAGTSAAARRAMQQNLAAVLGLIDPERPHASPLLMRAVTDHGKAGQAPLKAQSPPYRILQEWIDLTLAGNPFLREQHAPVRAAGPVAPAKAPTGDAAAPPGAVARVVPVVPQPQPPATTIAVPPQSPTVKPPTPVAPADEFDPAPFNQQLQAPRPSQ
jgi:hypothetical protein